MEQVKRPLFRLRLGSGRVVRPPVRYGPALPMVTRTLCIELTVAGLPARTPDEGDVGCVPTALALLRTVFEDHHTDPDHRFCLFFNGCTIGTCTAQYDFSVTHVGDAVLLSGFTFPQFKQLDSIRIPLELYAREVVGFARAALRLPMPPGLAPWAAQLLRQQREQLAGLLPLGEEFVASGCRDLAWFYDRFMAVHGYLKRPLELQILNVLAEGDADAGEPWEVEARVVFGPISVHELVPARLNGGDVVLLQATEFGVGGVRLSVMGVGSCGLRRGDLLLGLQLFYP